MALVCDLCKLGKAFVAYQNYELSKLAMRKLILILSGVLCFLEVAAQPSIVDSLHQLTTMATGSELTDLYLKIAEKYLSTNRDSSKLYTDLAYARCGQEKDSVRKVYTARALRLLAIQAWNAQRYDSAFLTIEQAVEEALASRDSTYICIMYRQYGVFYARREDDLKALELCKTALNYCPAEDTVNYVHLKSTQGILYHYLGLYDEALQSYLKIFSRFSENELNTFQLNHLYAYLGATYGALKNYEKALVYKRKGLAIAQQERNMDLQVTLLNNITNIYIDTENYLQAEEHATTAYHISDSIQDTTSLATASINLGRLYTHTKAYDVAERYLKQGQALTRASGDRYTFVSANYFLAQLYVSTRRLHQADTALNHALQVELLVPNGGLSGGSYPTIRQRVELYQAKAALDSLQKEFEEAYISQHWYIFYQDSLLSEERQKAIAQSEIRFESLQKDNEITLLRAENELQMIKEGQMTQQRAALIVGSVLLFGLLGVTHNRYRLKQRALGTIQTQKQPIEEKNAENELLIREIHHRVKNNLQIILSLLNTQATVLHDPEAVEVITESQNRVRSMALVHEKLYQSNNFTRVPAEPYLQEMAHNIAQAYRHHVRLQLKVEAVDISMSMAVPLGLILTELLTNAYKYAFEEGKENCLRVNFRSQGLNGHRQYVLQVADNGRGLPPDFDLDKSPSFGLKLVKGLVHQLRGELTIRSEQGTRFEIRFKELN